MRFLPVFWGMTLPVLSTALALGQPLPQRLTVKAMLEQPRWQDCRWSPGGEWLAVQVGQVDWGENRVKTEIQLYRAGSKQPAERVSDASGLRWSPDGSRFFFQRKGNLWVMRCDNWRQWQVTRQPVESASWSPDGQSLAFLAPRPGPEIPPKDSGRLYRDLFARRWNRYHDGRVLQLYVSDLEGTSRQVSSAFLGSQGQLRDAGPTSMAFSLGDSFCFSKDGSALLFSAPPARGQAYDTNYDVYRLELASGRVTNLTPDNLAADLAPRLDGANGKLYILSAQRPGYESDFLQLRSCSVDSSGQPQGSWTVEELRGGEGIQELEVLEDGSLLYVTQKDTRSLAYRRDPQGLLQLLPGEGSLSHLSAAGQSWAGLLVSLKGPPRVVVGDWNSTTTHRLGSEAPWTLGPVESLEVPVERASMQMWLIKPPHYSPEKRWPVVFLIHGGPQGGWSDAWSLRWNPHVWAAQGYLVVMPNPRGSSGRGRAFQEEVSRDWGGRVYRDLLAGFDAIAARPDVDPRRMAAAGASFGGYMVNWLAVHESRFRALVTHCGVWNLESMYGTTDELWFADWEFGGPPWGPKKPPDYDRFSPHRQAHKLGEFKTPHLVVHNELDYRCPVDQGLQLFSALQRQGVESEFLNFPDEGHWVLKPANGLRWHEEVFRFVRSHCPPL